MKLLSGASHDALFRPGRRGFVLSAAALAAFAITKPQALVFASSSSSADANFMIVSRLVSDATLDPQTAQALYGALSKKQDFDKNLEALAKLASASGMTIETLDAQLASPQQKALRGTLNEIVSAWYLGIVDNKTYAYHGALMYRPTADMLAPPSYTRAGPLWWAKGA
jgi:fructose 5-dehydrogenase small subunit